MIFHSKKQQRKVMADLNANKNKMRLSRSFGVTHTQPLTLAQIKKIMKERGIKEEDLGTEKDRLEGNARLISLHPTNEVLDNIIVKDDSPHRFDEKDLNKSEKLSEEQNKAVFGEMKEEEKKEKKDEK